MVVLYETYELIIVICEIVYVFPEKELTLVHLRLFEFERNAAS